MKPYILIAFVCFFSSTFFIYVLFPRLKKSAEQPIYAEGPQWHTKKQGTPTMGGVGFLFGISACASGIIAYLFSVHENVIAISLLLNISYALLNSFVGIYDDLKKIKKKQNEGLTPKQKLIFQSIISVLYLFLRTRTVGVNTSVSIFGYRIELGAWFYPIILFVMLGIVNCANLTDGVDGLASSVSSAIGIVVLIFSFAQSSDAPILGALLIGASFSFLLFNLNPAKIFMGDAGSLLLGAIAVGCAFSLSNPLFVLIIGIVYIIEGFSVVIQVVSFKIWKKRVFKMAPLHHHLELSGMHENKIAYLGFLATLAALLILLAFRS